MVANNLTDILRAGISFFGVILTEKSRGGLVGGAVLFTPESTEHFPSFLVLNAESPKYLSGNLSIQTLIYYHRV